MTDIAPVYKTRWSSLLQEHISFDLYIETDTIQIDEK